MAETSKSKTLTSYSLIAGAIGVIFFVLAVIVFYSDTLIARLDHKDFYFAGMGLLALAIWLKLGAIYHQG